MHTPSWRAQPSKQPMGGMDGTLCPAIYRALSSPCPHPPRLQVLDGLSVRGNRLTGPLFPPAWLAPGAMPHLKFLLLADNPGLTGPLPDRLPWPQLTSLSLAETSLQAAAIPSSWCSLPNVAVFDLL